MSPATLNDLVTYLETYFPKATVNDETDYRTEHRVLHILQGRRLHRVLIIDKAFLAHHTPEEVATVLDRIQLADLLHRADNCIAIDVHGKLCLFQHDRLSSTQA